MIRISMTLINHDEPPIGPGVLRSSNLARDSPSLRSHPYIANVFTANSCHYCLVHYHVLTVSDSYVSTYMCHIRYVSTDVCHIRYVSAHVKHNKMFESFPSCCMF